MRKYYDNNDEYSEEEKYFYLLLYSPGFSDKVNEQMKGNTWLQKQLHVISLLHNELGYEFDKHYFGTFSPVLQIIQEQNLQSGLIQQPTEKGPIWLSETGLKEAKKLWGKTKNSEKQIIQQVKKFLNDMKYWELIAYSYSSFPETTENSEIWLEFQKTRMDSAISLFKKNKISLKKAVSIAGMEIEEFEKLLQEKNIPAYSIKKDDFERSLEYLENIT